MTEKFDGVHFHFASDDRRFKLVDVLGFINITRRSWSSYFEDDQYGLVICWTLASSEFNPKTVLKPFPYDLGPADLAPIVMHWLNNQDYGTWPDNDGSVYRGWQVYNDPHTGDVGRHWYASFAVKPAWIIYGK